MVSAGAGGAVARRWIAEGPRASGLLVGGASLALYARTLLPDVATWDTAEFQAIGPVLGIAHPTGFPTYTLLAWLASVVLQPFGEPALRANLLSALLVASAAGLVAAVVAALGRRAIVGVASGAALAVAPTAWEVALRADAHALHLFLVALLLALLVAWEHRLAAAQPADRWLIAAAVVFGVSLGNHALTLLLAPGIALFVLYVEPRLLWRRPALVATCVVALALTTIALYAYLPIRSAMDPPLDYANPETLEGFRYLVFAEQFRGTFHDYPPAAEALRTVGASTLEQLGVMAILAPLGAAWALLRRAELLLLLGAWFCVTWLFALGYINAAIERYYLAPTLAAAVLGGLGALAVWRLLERVVAALGASRRVVRAPPAAVAALAALLLLGPVLAAVPARFDEVDASTDRGAREWLEAVLPQLDQDAVVMSWWSYSTTLWYALHVEGRRPDVLVIDDRTVLDQGLGSALAVVERYVGERPVYLIRLPTDLPEVSARYELTPLPGVPHWPVYRVERPAADAATHVAQNSAKGGWRIPTATMP